MMIDTYARIDRVLPALPGWCTPAKGRRLADLVIEARAQLCVELGVFGGRSLVAMALGLAHQGSGRVDGIDPYTVQAALEGSNAPANDEWWSTLDYGQILAAAHKGISDSALMAHARIVIARSQDVVGSYTPGSIDVLHQDSNHSEEVSTAEVRAWLPLVRSGGFWVIDDIDWPTTEQAQRLLAASGCERVETHGSWAIYRKG